MTRPGNLRQRLLRQAAFAFALGAALLIGGCETDEVDPPDAATNPTATAVPEATRIEPPAPTRMRLWIKPDLVECMGVAPQMCMQVATSPDGEYWWFYDQIEGFTFTPGNSYVLDVTVAEVSDPPADASSRRYTLVDVVETQSEQTGGEAR